MRGKILLRVWLGYLVSFGLLSFACHAWKNSLEGVVGLLSVFWPLILRLPAIGHRRRRAIAFQGQRGFASDDVQRG